MSKLIGLVARGTGERPWPGVTTATPDEDKKKLGIWIDGWMARAIQEWIDAYKPKFNETDVVKILLEVGLRAVSKNPAPFGLRPAKPKDVSPPKDDLTEEIQATKDLVGPVADEMAGEFESAKSSRRAARASEQSEPDEDSKGPRKRPRKGPAA